VRVAIVTGASRGLGASLAEVYRRRGWAVTGFARTASAGGEVRALDLADTDAAAGVFDEVLSGLAAGPCDEVVAIGNAALLGPVGPIESATHEAIRAHFDVNVVSAVLFARAVVSAFEPHDCPKTFVNVSSGAAVRCHVGWSLYCTSKAALESYVRALALEQAGQPNPVRAISVNPGVMDTAMQAEVRETSLEEFPDRERYRRLQREGMLAHPQEVAEKIADLVASRPEAGVTYAFGR